MIQAATTHGGRNLLFIKTFRGRTTLTHKVKEGKKYNYYHTDNKNARGRSLTEYKKFLWGAHDEIINSKLNWTYLP